MILIDVRFVKLRRKQKDIFFGTVLTSKMFWKRVLDWITNNTSHLCAFNITEQLVIFGVEDNVVTDRALDLIMLMAKHYIFRCRCLKVTPNFVYFSKGSQAKSSHREAYLINEGQPNYVFLALVPILPTDQ